MSVDFFFVFMILVVSTVMFSILVFSYEETDDYSSDEFIESVNSLETTWKAGRNIYSPVTRLKRNEIQDKAIADQFSILPFVGDIEPDLPTEFDSRIQWPYCSTIGQISDQASCGSCWAVSAVDAISDRVCIHSHGRFNIRLSAANVINCCHQCGRGCRGGTHRSAWNYWVIVGIVTGGSYESQEGCQPYQFPPCEHRMPGPRPDCTKYGPTPPCKYSCQAKYNVSYEKDLNFGKAAYSIIKNEEAIKTEIYRHGPVQGSLKLYSDLYAYKSGVYQHVKGKLIDDHAVRIIGWGVDNKSGVPYWLVANSFNYDWGEGGYFKIKRGTNECSIEEDITGGVPLDLYESLAVKSEKTET